MLFVAFVVLGLAALLIVLFHKQIINFLQNLNFIAIPDKYRTFEEVQAALRKAGLETSNLIIAVDFTKSNTWNGEKSFGGRSLHWIDPSKKTLNPYQRVIQVIGKTLSAFDDDQLIPSFGFGDVFTRDKSNFSFFPDRPCVTFNEVNSRYTEIVPDVQLSGPTNFGPVIREAINIVKSTKQYHVLIIVADGQVDVQHDTESAIVEASNYPLSIVVIGVGDGPFDLMEKYDDMLPERKFDNLQFVNFNKVTKRSESVEMQDMQFAVAALMELPDQYKKIRELGLL